MSFWKLRVDRQLITTNFTSLIPEPKASDQNAKRRKYAIAISKNYFLAKFVSFY